MKIVFLVFLGILALNALVILLITGILLLDYVRTRRRRAKDGTSVDDAHPHAP